VKSVPCLVLVVVLGTSAAVAPGCLTESGFTDLSQCTGADDVGTSCGGGLTCNGSGQCAACVQSDECGEPSPCATFTCADSACKVTYAAKGTALPDNMEGNCKSPQCDGHGAVVEVVDLNDVPTTTDPCIVEACTAAGPTQSSATMGTACSTGVCDGAGACVQCNLATDCSTTLTDPYCYDNTCASCSDGKQDGDETGVDCGGSHCGLCGGATCTAATDCQTMSCIVTAGGDVCGLPVNVPCMFDSQCASKTCTSGACTAP